MNRVEKRCATCQAFATDTSECRKRSPRPLHIGFSHSDSTEPIVVGVWPSTAANEWCEEWTLDGEKYNAEQERIRKESPRLGPLPTVKVGVGGDPEEQPQ